MKKSIAAIYPKEYKVWISMKYRCLTLSCKDYKDYGARGITIHEPWVKSFQLFFEHIGTMPGKDYTLERINNDIGYFPDNVRWATRLEQAHNRRPHLKHKENRGIAIICAYCKQVFYAYKCRERIFCNKKCYGKSKEINVNTAPASI